MVKWEALDAECDDETRQADDLGSLASLYEVVKLAYLQPNDEVIGLPQLYGSAAWGHVAVVLDCTIFVFGEGCSSLIMQLALDVPIDLALWIPQGEFLILGDNTGGVHCVHVQSQRVLITKHLPLKTTGVRLFVGGECRQSEDGMVSASLVTTHGEVVRWENIDSEAVCDSLRVGDKENLKALEAQMTLAVDDIDLGGSESLTWQFPHNPDCFRVIPVFDSRYVVTLDSAGKLTVLCGVTGITVWEVGSDEPPVLDVSLLQGDDHNIQLLLLLRNPDSGGCLLRIVSFPGFVTVYELSVNRDTNLVKIGEGAESILFLEPDMSPVTCVTSSLKLKSIVDGVPEARLAKLLMKRKFKEAEDFCGRFRLNIQDVHKARAKFLCDMMNPWITSAQNMSVIEIEGSGRQTEELLATLGKIQDSEFVTSLCIQASLPDLVTTKMVLNYAKGRLVNSIKSEEGDQLSNLMQRVSETTYRLQTFENIFPSSDIQHWLVFSSSDMLVEFVEHLGRGNLDSASTLWHRHQYEFSHQVDQLCVSQILDAFPHNVPSSVLCNWLPKNVLSDLVKFCPSSMEIIATWGDNRVKRLEVLERSAWPSNGLTLANTIISVLENVAADFQAGGNIEVQMAVHVAQWKAHSPSSALYHLRQTALALQDLQLLANKFRIKIEFNQYIQASTENKEAVVAALLDWLVCGEEVSPLMDDFVRSYLIRHELDYDGTLARYVLDTLASAFQDWWAWQEAPWEDKLYAVINIMSDAQIRAQCIVECVRVAPVPWSEGTHAMCKLGLSLNTSLSTQLEDQRRLVDLKLVLRRYSLHLTKIDDPRNSVMMLQNILSHDEKEAMDDALCVVATYKHLSRVDAYFTRAIYLLNTRNVEGVKTLLHGLKDSLQKQTCQKLIIYFTQKLLFSPSGQKEQESYKAVTGGMVALESILKKWHHKTGTPSDEDFFTTIHNLHTMQEKYDIYPTLRELEDKTCCYKILKDKVSDWYKEYGLVWDTEEQAIDTRSCDPVVTDTKRPDVNKEEKDTSRGLNHMQQLAFLLDVPRGDLFSLLASLAAKNGKLKEAVHVCREIIADPTVLDCTEVGYEIVKLLVEQLNIELISHNESSSPNSTALQERTASVKSRADLIGVIHEIVGLALTSAHPDLLEPLLELGTWCQLGQTLYSQCHVESIYTKSSAVESCNPYSIWKFSPLFHDASMPIEDGLVTSLMTHSMEACLNSQLPQARTLSLPYLGNGEKGAYLLENGSLNNSLQDLISHLRERGQDLLALNLSLLLFQNHIISGTQSLVAGCLPDWQQVFTILLKVIGSTRPDVILAVSLLVLLTKKDALKVQNELIKRFGIDYTRLISVATVGRDYCTLHKLTEVKEQFDLLLKRVLWGKRLGDMNVSFKEAFKGDVTALKKVMVDFVSHSECSFSLLYDYCKDFNLDVTDALLLYLRTTLQSWTPEVPSEEFPSGGIIKVEPPRTVISKCQTIIAEISNKTLLYKMLQTKLNLLSPYNYELIELVVQQLILLEQDSQELSLLKRGLDVINFLGVYIRQAPPSDFEVDEWVSSHPQSLGPPDISKHRLPFHELFRRSKYLMKIIEPELNVSTVDTWLQASHTLKLNPDQLCLIATQNTVSKALERESPEKSEVSTGASESNNLKNSPWQVCSSNSALLTCVRRVVSKIQHGELATACANWVVNRLPPGADKVEAAEKSKLLAKQWQENSPDPKAAEAYLRMSNRYEQLAIEHALHKHSLGEPQYLALTRTPVELVFALYQHPSLDSLATLGTHTMPDINGCVSDICSITDCNQVLIQLDLVEKWLPPPEDDHGLGSEETVTNFKIALDPSSAIDEDPADDASLSRVIYLLRCCPQNEAVSYLLNRALSEDTSFSAAYRLRALRCVLAIADEDTIRKYCPKGIASIRSYLQTMTYVSRLEALGHATNEKQFNSIDKSLLVEGLWRSQRHNPMALTLLTDLCHDYKVTTASLWGAVLTQLTNFVKLGQMDIAVLERVLIQVKTLPHLWVVPALTTAWITLINYPFTKGHPSPLLVNSYENSLASCLRSVDLLLRHCPVIVPTAPLLKHCANLHLPLLALSIAAADQVESHDLQALIDKTPIATLKSDYQKLKSTFAFQRSVEDVMESLQ
ncbi:Kinetochore-associated protein 1-like [Homarus americanus]|uniref:Kinetochore-associated protein 1-like n=1 Tax=Homarus americanus TaxID=6706 RepID=A0A8J5MY28_HOMAM|nr:Kinetochore-associated protein 1-like [Homarus americanus]